MKIKTLGSISASKDIIFSIRVPENNYSEMNKLPDTLVCGETDALRAWIRPRKAYPRLLVIIGRNGDPKMSFQKIHYFGEHSLLGYASLPCSGRMSENLVTQNSFSSESALTKVCPNGIDVRK